MKTVPFFLALEESGTLRSIQHSTHDAHVICPPPHPGIPDSNDHSDEEEEEAWLDALEAGQVDERGYLPKKKEQGTLTARQVMCRGRDVGSEESWYGGNFFEYSLPPPPF